MQMGTDSKSTTKDGKSVQAKRYNQDVIDALSIKHGLAKTFIRQCINGTRTSLTAETVKKDYHSTLERVNKALK